MTFSLIRYTLPEGSEMKAQDPKSLRVAVSSLHDFLQVCVRTINTFGTDDCSDVVETNNLDEGGTQMKIE